MRITLPVFFVLLVACTKEVDLPFPTSSSQVVLNGLLHPDSTIRITLTKTIPLDEKPNFPVITDASVVLYEDDRIVDTLMLQQNEYVLNYYPQADKEYTVEATVPDYGIVRASDVVPSRPVAEACFRRDTKNRYMFTSYLIEINITDIATEQNAYWLDIVHAFYEDEFCDIVDDKYVCEEINPPVYHQVRQSYYESFSPLPDRFNSFIDNYAGGVTAYDLYVRISDVSLEGSTITLDIASTTGQGSSTSAEFSSQQMNIISSSPTYDRYLKSSIIHYLNNDAFDEPNPFAEPTRVYSNVENGLGIFAAYNSIGIAVEDFPCP